MYPATFPKTAPYVRIVNPNPQQFAPSNYYLQLKSKSDQMSFLLNDVLKEVKGWTPNHSVVNHILSKARIIIEANDLVRTNYPFQFINQIPVQYPPQNQGVSLSLSSGIIKGSQIKTILKTMGNSTISNLRIIIIGLIVSNNLPFLSKQHQT